MARFRFLNRIFGVGGPLRRFRKPIRLDDEYPKQISAWAKSLKNDVELTTAELDELRAKYQAQKPKSRKKSTDSKGDQQL